VGKNTYNQKIEHLQNYGNNSLSYLTISNNLDIFTGKWMGYIAYKKFFHTLIILGDPIVKKNDLDKALQDLKNIQQQKKNHICFFINSEENKDKLIQNGYKGFLVGREAIVTLSNFSIAGRKGWKIRSSINYAQRIGLKVEEYQYHRKRSKDIEDQLHEITIEWCKIKKMPEFTFAFGHVDLSTFKDARIFLCFQESKIVGYLIYFPIFGKKSYYLDLSRRRINAPRGTIDFLFVKSFEILQKEMIKKIYIGYSPILDTVITGYNTKYGAKLFSLFQPFLEFFYPAKKEYYFKNKYATEWENNYFFYYPYISIRMLFGLVHAIYNGGIAGILLGKLKYLLK
jgi:phosphatidylglycerol lysyltransferase